MANITLILKINSYEHLPLSLFFFLSTLNSQLDVLVHIAGGMQCLPLLYQSADSLWHFTQFLSSLQGILYCSLGFGHERAPLCLSCYNFSKVSVPNHCRLALQTPQSSQIQSKNKHSEISKVNPIARHCCHWSGACP